MSKQIHVDRKRIRKALFPTESGPIIKSRLQNDFYKYSMGFFFWYFYSFTQTGYALTNRTKKIRLADEIRPEDLARELTHLGSLRYAEDELSYIAGLRNESNAMFPESYIEALRHSTLPGYKLNVSDGQFDFTAEGRWCYATDWEVPTLTIISALRTEAVMKKLSKKKQNEIIEYTAKAIETKITVLLAHPEVFFSDFCTRRAASPLLQEYIIEIILEHIWKQFVGTSNVYFAKQFGISPSGTTAHEKDSVIAALAKNDEELRQSPIEAARKWWKLYGRGLSILLPDTFGSDWMFKNLPAEFAQDWRGMRQDSMDLIEFGEKQIKFYKKHGQDPRERLMIPSDGLTLDSILGVTKHFKDRMKISSGWGSFLGNDTNLGHPSIVIKAVSADGRSCVKLSDNIAKAIGPRDEIERYKRVFEYGSTNNTECSC